MKIERMIPTVIVMMEAPAAPVVPQFFQFRHGGRSFQIHVIEESCVRFLAVILPLDIDIQRLVEQILFRRHDIDDVAERFGRVRCGVDVDVNAAGIVDAPACRPQSLFRIFLK